MKFSWNYWGDNLLYKAFHHSLLTSSKVIWSEFHWHLRKFQPEKYFSFFSWDLDDSGIIGDLHYTPYKVTNLSWKVPNLASISSTFGLKKFMAFVDFSGNLVWTYFTQATALLGIRRNPENLKWWKNNDAFKNLPPIIQRPIYEMRDTLWFKFILSQYQLIICKL